MPIKLNSPVKLGPAIVRVQVETVSVTVYKSVISVRIMYFGLNDAGKIITNKPQFANLTPAASAPIIAALSSGAEKTIAAAEAALVGFLKN
jgi:hypothetical protein